MECFGDIQKLSANCSDSWRFLSKRFAVTNSDAEIIISESGNLATKYNTEQSKSLQSWSFDELNKLLLPLAVYYPSDANGRETLIGLHSGNTLFEWTQNKTNDLVQSSKKHFRNTISAILTGPLTSKFGPIIVFSNGVAEFLSKLKLDVDEDAPAVIEADEQIIGIESYFSKKSVVLYYIFKNNKSDKLGVYKSTINHSTSRSINKIQKALFNEDINAWTYSNALNCLIGASKKENNILIHSLEPVFLTKSPKKDALSVFDSNSSDTICSMSCCSNGAICILTENVSSDASYQLQVFETKYCTRIGELNLSEFILTEDFCVIGDSAYITCKNNVIVVPILKQNALLSQLLTKNLTESEKNEVKSMNTIKFKNMFGIVERDETIDLENIKAINAKFLKFAARKNDAPEELIVSLFDFCTRNYLDIRNDPAKNDKEILNELESFFSRMVQLPYNEIFLVSCFKSSNITFEQYLLSIDLLLNLLPCKDCSIVSWISALLDVNFRQFIIKPNAEAQATLNKIYNYLTRNIRFYEDLGPIKTILESLIKREQAVLSAISNETTTIGQYSIELLSFT